MEHTAGFLRIVDDARSRVRQETAAEALARLKTHPGAVLIDVREDDEWRAGHVRGAIHLGKGIIEREVERTFPNKDLEMHLYCGGGYRSALAADNLQKMGYGNVISIDGGIRALQALGVEMEAG